MRYNLINLSYIGSVKGASYFLSMVCWIIITSFLKSSIIIGNKKEGNNGKNPIISRQNHALLSTIDEDNKDNSMLSSYYWKLNKKLNKNFTVLPATIKDILNGNMLFQSPYNIYHNNKLSLLKLGEVSIGYKDYISTNEIIIMLEKKHDNFNQEVAIMPIVKQYHIDWKPGALLGIRNGSSFRECYFGKTIGYFGIMNLHPYLDGGGGIFFLGKVHIPQKTLFNTNNVAHLFHIKNRVFFSIGIRFITNIITKITINKNKKQLLRLIILGINMDWYPALTYDLLESMKKSEIRFSISSLFYKKLLLGIFNFNPHWKKNLLLIPVMLF